jgi:hypothetical protein
MTRGYVVRCADGAVRHDDPFFTREDAATFAEWGHACLARHDIDEVELCTACEERYAVHHSYDEHNGPVALCADCEANVR